MIPVRLVPCVLLLTIVSAADAQPRTDRHGDPLPTGALVRLGTTRWRSGNTIVQARFYGDRHLITLNSEGRVERWDRTSGRVVQSIDVHSHRPTFSSISISAMGNTAQFSADCRRLAILWPDRRVHVWDIEKGVLKREISLDSFVNNIAISHDGKRVAVLENNLNVLVFSADSEDPPQRLAGDRENGSHISYRFAFSADGQSLLLAGLDFQNQLTPLIRRWSLKGNQPVERIKLPPQMTSSSISRSVISPDTRYLAGTVTGGGIMVCSVQDGSLVRKIMATGVDYTTRLAFSSDGRLVFAVPSMGEPVRGWELETGREAIHIGEKQPAGVLPVVSRQQCFMTVSNDGKFLLAPSDSHLRMIDLTSTTLPPGDDGHDATIRHVSFDATGRTVLTCATDFTVCRWNATTGELLGTARVSPRAAEFIVAPNGRWIAVTERGSGTRVIDLATTRELVMVGSLGTAGQNATFSPDSSVLAVAGRNTSEVHLYELPSGRKRAELRLPEPPPPLSTVRPGVVISRITYKRMTFSGDGRSLAVLVNNQLSLWDSVRGRVIAVADFTSRESPSTIALSPDGQTAAIESSNGRISIWELASGKQRVVLDDDQRVMVSVLARSMTDPAGPATTLAFSADGRRLVRGQADRTIRVWDIVTGEALAKFSGHTGQPMAVSFSADGKYLVSAGTDTVALVWNAPVAATFPLPTVSKLNPERLAQTWDELRSTDAEAAWKAMTTLMADPERATPYVRQRLQPATGPSDEELSTLISQLNETRYPARRQAARVLARFGELAETALQEAAQSHPALEVRATARRLLDQIGIAPTVGDKLREMRAVQVLEFIGTAEAHATLRLLANGAPIAIPTQQARGALTRLERTTR